MKKPTTFEEQLDILRSKGLLIGDESKCIDILRAVNYYRFTAYLLPFRGKGGTYLPCTTFETIHRIYEFDRRIRALLLAVIEEIELYLRTQLSYYSAHHHGALAYLDPAYFNPKHNHEFFLKFIEDAIHDHRNTPVVKHHQAKYNGLFPIWVIIDYFSTGSLSYFYADLTVDDKKIIASDLFNTNYTYLESWLKCLTNLRNHCAHYSRLYFALFTDIPKIPPKKDYLCTRRLFDQIIMLQMLYRNKQKWNTTFLVELEALMLEYSDCITLTHIGFPDNWKDVLEFQIKSIIGSTN